MSTICVVQARMGSTRLPGKVVADLGGRPLLAFMLGRLGDLPVDALVVATSDLDRDDTVAEVADAAGAAVVRGPEADVLGRFGSVLDRFPAETVVRLTADCPFADPEIVTAVLDHHRDHGDDYTSNVAPRTYPIGLDVEVAAATALRDAIREATDPAEREHVMPFLYRRPERFHLGNVRSGEDDLAHLRWVVDTADDLEHARRIAAHFAPDTRFGWREILAAFDERPSATGLRLRLATAADSDRLLAWRNDPAAIRWSVTGSAVERAEHATWFATRLDDPGCRLWIAEVDGEPVGQVRIDVADGIGTVSLAVAPSYRGRGLAPALLMALIDEVATEVQVTGLRAIVHPDNVRSVRAFTTAGFTEAGTEDAFTVFTRPQATGRPDREKRT